MARKKETSITEPDTQAEDIAHLVMRKVYGPLGDGRPAETREEILHAVRDYAQVLISTKPDLAKLSEATDRLTSFAGIDYAFALQNGVGDEVHENRDKAAGYHGKNSHTAFAEKVLRSLYTDAGQEDTIVGFQSRISGTSPENIAPANSWDMMVKALTPHVRSYRTSIVAKLIPDYPPLERTLLLARDFARALMSPEDKKRAMDQALRSASSGSFRIPAQLSEKEIVAADNVLKGVLAAIQQEKKASKARGNERSL